MIQDDENAAIIDDDKKFLMQSTRPALAWNYPTPDILNYIHNQTNMTTKSDIFQLGLVIAEMLTGSVPLKKRNILKENIELDFKKFSMISGKFSQHTKNIISKMLILDPLKRPDANELMDYFIGDFEKFSKELKSLTGKPIE